jgi:hypothetical protein
MYVMVVDLGVLHQLVLALDSTLPDHIEWALNQLTVLSYGSTRVPDCDLIVTTCPGLLDALVRQLRLPRHPSASDCRPSLFAAPFNRVAADKEYDDDDDDDDTIDRLRKRRRSGDRNVALNVRA